MNAVITVAGVHGTVVGLQNIASSGGSLIQLAQAQTSTGSIVNIVVVNGKAALATAKTLASLGVVAGTSKNTIDASQQKCDNTCDTKKPQPEKPKPKNPHGSKGKPDHQNKVKDLKQKALDEIKPGEKVLTEKKIQNPKSSRRPDVQIVDKQKNARKVFEAERYPRYKRNRLREAEYKKLGVEYETHKLD